VNLTADNYQAETNGKSVFIKFFAPWCGHCKAMAEDWVKIGEEFGGKNDVLIGEVDCTDEENGGADLCNLNDIQGFPSLKYGHPLNLEDYEGGREYITMADFAQENLGPQCGPANLDLCDDEKKALIASYMNMADDELNQLIADKLKIIEDAQTTFQTGVEELEMEYQQASVAAEGGEGSAEAVVMQAILVDREMVEKLLKLSDEELTKLREEKEAEIATNQVDMDALIQRLQETFMTLQEKYDSARNEVKSSGLTMMQMVALHKGQANSEL
jgi:thiol-disulfide isomerase/thioredoxin